MSNRTDTSVVGVLESRAALLREIRRFFEARDFIEVDTPAIVPSPGLDVHLSAFEVCDPEGRTVGWLATSPEYQMKRLLSAGATRIFQLGKSFRADEQGRLHEREFTMLEWYRAHATAEDVMQDTEALATHLTPLAKGDSPLLRGVNERWERETVESVVRRYAGLDAEVLAVDEEAFFRVWVEKVQPRLGEDAPTFVTNWPASMASLARINDDGTADRFEAFYRGIELCNGFGELTDATEQRRRFESDRLARHRAGKSVYPIDERFLEALEGGMPESGGNALGVDRLLMLLEGLDSIQAVMPFPADRL
ncbi:MAG: EF-P lysine aminoacylase EpmA [Polyangiales bacterium]